MRPRQFVYLCGFPATLAVLLGACVTQTSTITVPERQFGHRYESGIGGRLNAAIVPADPAKSYFFYPAFIESLYVRPAPFDSVTLSDPEVSVEVLVQGAFADACSELDTISQRRAGHILNVELLMRRPRGEVCARVKRPYRFYFSLDGHYQPGSYLLKVNRIPYTFEIRQPLGAGARQ